LPIAEIDKATVAAVLEPVEKAKFKTALRLRNRIETVFDFAINVKEYRAAPNPASASKVERKLTRDRTKRAGVQHVPAVPYRELGDFIAKLRSQETVAAWALEFAILTAARPGEALNARWSEIDFATRIRTIQSEHMKTREVHRVMLSEPVVALLSRLPR
jgi:integrase